MTTFPIGTRSDGSTVAWDPSQHPNLIIADCGTEDDPQYRPSAHAIAATALVEGWKVDMISAPPAAPGQPEPAWRPIRDVLHSLRDDLELRTTLAADRRAAAAPCTPILLVITDYQRVIATLRHGEQATPAAAEHDLDRIVANGRDVGVHVVLAGHVMDFCPRLMSASMRDQFQSRYLLRCRPAHPAIAQLIDAQQQPGAVTRNVLRLGDTTHLLQDAGVLGVLS